MVIFERHNLLNYLKGKGIEIGALNSPQRVNFKKCQVKYVDWLNKDGLTKHNPTVLPENIKDPDIVASATDLGVITSESVDFVIANQILEHLPNPIKALTEFYRVLKTGGILYLSIPDKKYTFDEERPITPLSHITDDYKKNASIESNPSHYEEWTKLVEEKRPIDSPLRWKLEDILNVGCAIHFHVWTPESIVEIFNYLKNDIKIPFFLKDYYYKNGESPFIFVLEKVPFCEDIDMPLKEKYSIFKIFLSKTEYKTKKFLLRIFNFASIVKNLFYATVGLIEVLYNNARLRVLRQRPKVKSLVYEVTEVCNSHCIHCNIWKQKSAQNILTAEEVEKLLKDDFFSDMENILLTGGEVVTRNDIKEIISAIHGARPKVKISFSTNAILAEKVLDVALHAVEKKIPLFFGISLDAVGEKHDFIRGTPGNFKKADFLIKELIKLRTSHPDIIKGISVGHTLSNLTVDTIKEVMDYAKKLNIVFSTQLYEEFPYYYNKGEVKKEKNLKDYKKGDNRLLVATVESLPASFHHEMLLRLLRSGGLKFRCSAMSTFFVLRSDGSMAPCLSYCNVKAGNVRDGKISDIWNSASAGEVRNVVSKCSGCSNTWGYGWSYRDWPLPFWKIVFKLKFKRFFMNKTR